jgi:uncharacterized membrane protein
MKYLISLLKYILIVIVIIAIFTGLRIVLPQGNIELTYNQAVAFVVIGIIAIAVALKYTFTDKY